MADEQEISRRYRELAREEPPRRVDDAILAAARRAAAPRARRWYIPLAAAAVLVLAVAVAFQVDRGEPDREALVLAPPAPSGASEEQRKERERQEPKRESFKAESAPLQDLQKAPSPDPASPPPAAAREDAAQARAAPELRAGAKLSENTAGAAASPEQWLQGIMDLRRQARDVEADQQLAEFRKRYPDYRIDEATMRKLSLP
jgi:hypothetical protein